MSKCRVNSMSIVLFPGQWNRLKLDDPDNYELARCAFFIGLGIEKIHTLCMFKASPERPGILATARFLGIDANDRIVKRKFNANSSQKQGDRGSNP